MMGGEQPSSEQEKPCGRFTTPKDMESCSIRVHTLLRLSSFEKPSINATNVTSLNPRCTHFPKQLLFLHQSVFQSKKDKVIHRNAERQNGDLLLQKTGATCKLIKINDVFAQSKELLRLKSLLTSFPFCCGEAVKRASASSTRADTVGAPIHNLGLSFLNPHSLFFTQRQYRQVSVGKEVKQWLVPD